MGWPWKRAPASEPERVDPREDAREYVLCGDNLWGCSITWSTRPGELRDHKGDSTYASVVGWLPNPIPEPGDVILAPMTRGWGRWVVQKVERAQGVHDMFFADVRGCLGYEENVEGKVATERLKSHQQSEYV
jgi:hypothetical protein